MTNDCIFNNREEKCCNALIEQICKVSRETEKCPFYKSTKEWQYDIVVRRKN